MLRYCLTASLLGSGWFLVLMVPRITREWLLGDIWRNLMCLVIASVLAAIVCRGFIRRAETFGDHLIRAALVPYFGCFTFLSLWAALLWTQSLLYGGLANAHDTLSLFAMGMTAAAVSFFVVIPYGLLCQYVMHAVLHSDATGARG
jgi:hypothetical protein